MNKLNNKGQALVMFVVIIPIFLLIITLVYDMAGIIYEKNRLSNVAYMTVDYGLDNIEELKESELIELITKNIDNPNYISVSIDSEQIEVKITKEIKTAIGKVFNLQLAEVNTHYKGKKIEDKKEIERIK